MTSWAIVAIPEDGDPVWKISSEKVPHITLLFLGEQDDKDKALHITEYLQHVVNTSAEKFWLNVSHRGVLGDKKADVLFFDTTSKQIQRVAEVRKLLLQDSQINESFLSTEQFEGWTPHLTLGYPGTPAKKVQGVASLPVYSVYFNRLALWVDDYDGPSFDLKYRDEFAEASDTIAHRQQRELALKQQMIRPSDLVLRGTLGRRASKSQVKAPRFSVNQHVIHYDHPVYAATLEAIEDMRPFVDQLSHSDRFLNDVVSGELRHGSTSAAKRHYVETHQGLFLQHMHSHMAERSPLGPHQRIAIATRPDGDWLLSTVDLRTNNGTLEHRIHPVTDERGVILDYQLLDASFTPEDSRTALMHYGVKGMKWGQRRSRSSDSSGGIGGVVAKVKGEVKRRSDAKKKAVEESRSLEGNAGPGSNSFSKKSDAQKIADKREATKFDAKSSWKKPKASAEAEINNLALKRTKDHGTDMMSNKELKAMVTRMNLEQQYKTLVESDKPKSAREAGKEYVSDILKQAGQEIAVELIKGAVASGGAAAKNQATNSNSRSRTFVSATTRRARSSTPQIGPGMREILQLPPGRG